MGTEYIENPYFKKEKLACQHTGLYFMQEDFLEKLIALRKKYNKPIICVSGCRDLTHPIEAAKKRKPGQAPSPHTICAAADLRIPREDYADVIKIALNMNMRVGARCQRSGVLRLHVDSLWNRPIRFWTYSS